MMEAARTSETSVDNYFTRQYIPEGKSEIPKLLMSKVIVRYVTLFYVATDVSDELVSMEAIFFSQTLVTT
jgi:hypothetical protein